MTARSETITNFGANVSFTPRSVYRPKSESEVLDILRAHKQEQIRVVGRLHAWSPLVESTEVIISLENLKSVQVAEREGQCVAVVGAGCQIKQMLAELRKSGLTSPALGLITEQTVAGAMATATHGSGRQALCHFAKAIRVAHYDSATGEPVISEVRTGDELRALQCSLGMLGVLLSVEIHPRAEYHIEEWLTMEPSLEQVMAAETTAPLQQFYYLPWNERFLVQHRFETQAPRSWLAPLYRLYWYLVIDVGLHLVILLFSRWLKSRRGIKWFFRWLAPCTLVRNWHVVDRSSDMLIMEHELFRHLEIELFVRRSNLQDAMDFTHAMIRHFGGEESLPQSWIERLPRGLSHSLPELFGSYTHHYPVCVRRVLPDQSMVSMSSGGDEDYYAVSFITYCAPNSRQAFFELAHALSQAMDSMFDARCHWGKYCPLDAGKVRRNYPELDSFLRIARAFDPKGQFTNGWLARIMPTTRTDEVVQKST
ncbi:MAG: FAD-binding protein [Planctomycetaceae bacterium]|nr:FAD-binding protein [Planctomycetaceae bacterium]